MKYYLTNRNNDRGLINSDWSDFFRPFWASEDYGFRADISEKDGMVVIEADMPGVDKKDISVELSDGYLTLSSRKEETKNEEEKGRYIRRERRTGMSSRSFYVGNGVEESDISALYENGTLKISFPTEAQNRKDTTHRIQIK